METVNILTLSLCIIQATHRTSSLQPNFVILLMDDVGYGDITSFWNPDNLGASTPYVDYMAANGLRFTDFNAAGPSCVPSRASLLTARLGARTGLRETIFPTTQGGLPINETTFGETFSKAGYKTGMIGKWHMGVRSDFHPNSRALPYYNGRKIVDQPLNITYLSPRYAQEAERFIMDRETTTPFLLYVGLQHTHVPFFYMPEFIGKSARGDAYGDALLEMDWVIETIVKIIEKNGEAENTLIWVASDNGPDEAQCQYGGDPGPFVGQWQRTSGGGGSSSKHTVWEGGHRMPALAYWPGTIDSGRVSDEMVSMMDIYPTMASLAGIDMPGNRIYDGIDISNILFEEPFSSSERVLYHPLDRYEKEDDRGLMGAVRVGEFKAVFNTGGYPECGGQFGPATAHNPPLIFNVKEDPKETNPIDPGSSKYQSVMMEVDQALADLEHSLQHDNISVVDHTLNPCVMPCCNPLNVVCRCT